MSKILIIDDEVSVREALRDRIESMGHEVEEASYGEEALKLVGEMAYDCILLDLGIPHRFEGPSNIHHGKNLLQRLVAMQGAPPVIVITANGLNDWQLASEMQDIGAEAFIGKPFDDHRIEERIRSALETMRSGASVDDARRAPFTGGNIVMHDDRIELCGEEVGGIRGDALIRQILPNLARKNGLEHYIISSRKELASAIGTQISEAAIASAIKDFREKCTAKLGCGPHDVILTNRSGGYQLAKTIVYQIGTEERVGTQAEQDRATILKELRRFKTRTRRQISDRTSMPVARVKAALSALDDESLLTLKGTGANAVYSLKPGD
jgi:DNA-binding response OmpR family regulator